MSHQNLTSEPCFCGDALDLCLCYNLRRVARKVRLRYDEELRPAGLTSNQYLLLVAICDAENITMHQLADKMGSDRTVLSRTLKPLEAEKLIRIVSGQDRRTRQISMTDTGLSKMQEAHPYWHKAQQYVYQILGKEKVSHLIDQLKVTAQKVS